MCRKSLLLLGLARVSRLGTRIYLSVSLSELGLSLYTRLYAHYTQCPQLHTRLYAHYTARPHSTSMNRGPFWTPHPCQLDGNAVPARVCRGSGRLELGPRQDECAAACTF